MSNDMKRRFLISKWRGEPKALRQRIDELEQIIEQSDGTETAQAQALETVRYWLLDVLVHHKPVSDPRRILQTVENAL